MVFFEWSKSGAGRWFGVERVIDLLGKCHQLSAAKIIEELRRAVVAFARDTPRATISRLLSSRSYRPPPARGTMV